MNFNNTLSNSNALGKTNKAQGLDLLGLSQQMRGDQLVTLGNGQNGESIFANLLDQIGNAGEGLSDLLGEAQLNNPEEVFQLIDNFPKEFKLNFLEELKQDLPELIQGLEVSKGTEKSLLAQPSEIVTKIQEVIDLVKDGGQKIAEAFQKVFDGGVFDSLFNAEGDVASEKVMASLDAKLKQLTSKENSQSQKALGAPELAKSDDAVELHNFMRKNVKAQPNKLRNFSQFQNKDSIIKAAQSTQPVVAEELPIQKLIKTQNTNPYMKSGEDNIIKAQQGLTSIEGQSAEQGMSNFMGQGGSQLNMDFLAAQQMQENAQVEGAEKTGEAQVLDFTKLTENSSNKAEVIKNVTNYLEQMQFNNQKELDVAVRHNELGEFNIQVSKDVKTNNLDLQIKAMTEEGINFFQENEAELAKTLSDKGIKLSSFKIGAKGESIMSSGMEKSDSGSSHQQNRDEQSQGYSQFKGQQNKDQDGQQRRRELWQKYQEQMAS